MKFEDLSFIDGNYEYKNIQFCDKCGKRLIPQNEPKRHHYQAGKPIYKIKIKCPNKKWWNRHDVVSLISKDTHWELEGAGEYLM